MYDLLITNARILDGSGQTSYAGAVAVRDGRIAAVGEIEGEARERIDAGGLALAPGFLDPHTHYDAQLVWDGFAQPALEHGVTTVMPGNCSLSLAPLRSEHRAYLGETFRKIEEMPQSAFDAGLVWSWETFEEYLDAIRPGLGINVAPIVGHSLLRLWVLGIEACERPSTDAEIVAIQGLLRRCLDAGAVAMSSSWVDVDAAGRPVPSRMADPRELDALCAVLGERDAVLQIVPEFWDVDLLDARIDILADLSRRHDILCTFSPLFDSNATPELTGRALERVRTQVAHGARVLPQMQVRAIDLAFELDQPSSVFATLPGWWRTLSLPAAERRAAFEDPAARQALVSEVEGMMMPIGLHLDFGLARIKRVATPAMKPLEGRLLGEVAAERGADPISLMIEIALAEDFTASFGFEGVGHNDSAKIGGMLDDPLVGIGAGDGGAHVSRFSTYGDTGLLLAHYVRERGVMSLEHAVRKLTHDVADAWGVRDRGLLRPGFAADLVLFDPASIDRGPEIAVHDLPGDGFRYLRRGIGIAKVFVNGALAWDAEAGYADQRAGAIVPLAA